MELCIWLACSSSETVLFATQSLCRSCRNSAHSPSLFASLSSRDARQNPLNPVVAQARKENYERTVARIEPRISGVKGACSANCASEAPLLGWA
jgi:hypothetical protein